MRQVINSDSLNVAYDGTAEIYFVTKDTVNTTSQKDSIRAAGSASVRISYKPIKDVEFVIHEAAIGGAVQAGEVSLKFKVGEYDITLGECKIAGPVEDVNIDGLSIGGNLMDTKFTIFAGQSDATTSQDLAQTATEKGIMLSKKMGGLKMHFLNVDGSLNKNELGIEGEANGFEYELGYDLGNSGRRYVRTKFADIELKHGKVIATGSNEESYNSLTYDLSKLPAMRGEDEEKGDFELRYRSSKRADGNQFDKFGVRGALPDKKFKA